MSVFRGAGVALVTPFKEDKSVNFEVLERLIDAQIKGKTDALIVCGTTGEPATMSEQERLAVIKFAVEKANGLIPVVAGVGSNSTDSVVSFARRVEKTGVSGLLIVTPYYNKATQKGLYEHYATIASKVGLPIIIYNVPSRSGCNILPETIEKIVSDYDNVVGIKEASGNISQVAKIRKLTGGKIDIYSGNDDQIIPVLSLGGSGVISVLSNIAPVETHDMVMKYLNGNHKAALELQLKYMDLINSLFCEVNPIPVKAALNLMGYNVGGLRLPLTEIEEEHKQVLITRMKEVELI